MPIEGSWIEYKGYVTGNIFTTILEDSYNGYVDDVYLVSLVIANNTTVGGDSGGPVLRDNDDGTYTAVGIITGKVLNGVNTGKMIYSRLKHIRTGISGLSVAAFN